MLNRDEWARVWNSAASLAEAAAALGTTPKRAKSMASKLRAAGLVLQDFRTGTAPLVRRLHRLRTERDQLRAEADLVREEEFLLREIETLRERRGR